MMVEISERISGCFNQSREDYYRAMRRSLLLSADMAHAVHPNYSGKHQPQHMPKMHEGIVLKINAN